MNFIKTELGYKPYSLFERICIDPKIVSALFTVLLEKDSIHIMEASSDQIARLESEILQLELELNKKKMELASLKNINKNANHVTVSNNSHSDEKIKLFRSLFRGREDVFALRFESKRTGKSGYQPACRNEWVRNLQNHT